MRLGWLGSFTLGAAAVLALVLDNTSGLSHPPRLGAALLLLFTFHLARYPRFWICREFTLYAGLSAYMSIELLWSEDASLALGIIMMSLNFLLIAVLFAALVIYHDLAATLGGMLGGFLAGAAYYTFAHRFPFVYPDEFSYNAIANMYLFGLFITALLGCYMRWRLLPILVGFVLLLHIVATTSIKTNLGIVLGAISAVILNLKLSAKALLRNLIALAIVGSAAAYFVASNDALMERVNGGLQRATAGAAILYAREDVNNIGFGTRIGWKDRGLEGWSRNPLFGRGVEAFRVDFGITSHSTPIDLLYNSGLIGCALFYAIFASLAWRVVRGKNLKGLRAVMLAGFVCYMFMSLSGTLYYDTFLAASLGISLALLRRLDTESMRSTREEQRFATAR